MITAVLLLLFARTDAQILTWPAFKTYMRGPGQNQSFCCQEACDLFPDGRIDLRDFAVLQREWSCLPNDPTVCGKISTVEVEKLR